MNKIISPTLNTKTFTCPHCCILSEHNWSTNITCNYKKQQPNGGQFLTSFDLKDSAIAKCSTCEDVSIWMNDKMIYPLDGNKNMSISAK